MHILTRAAQANIEGYEPNYLETVVANSTTTKARLLHYFPPEESSASEEEGLDSWCGTHLDHGCLTGLTSALWTDEEGLPENATIDDIRELSSPPDPEAGLYIMDRMGELKKVAIPKDALAFQTGEALQSITNGKLKAVPHLVKGPRRDLKVGKVSRNTLAVFTRKFSRMRGEFCSTNHSGRTESSRQSCPKQRLRDFCKRDRREEYSWLEQSMQKE